MDWNQALSNAGNAIAQMILNNKAVAQQEENQKNVSGLFKKFLSNYGDVQDSQFPNQGDVDINQLNMARRDKATEALSGMAANPYAMQSLNPIMKMMEMNKTTTGYENVGGIVYPTTEKGGNKNIDMNKPMNTPQERQFEINNFRDAIAKAFFEQDPVKKKQYENLSNTLYQKELDLTQGKSNIAVDAYGRKLEKWMPYQERLDKIRTANREAVKSVSPLALNAIVTRFDSDPVVRKYKTSADAADIIVDLVDNNSPIAAASIPTFMARASGEVGNLSEADKAPFGGSRALLDKMEQVINTAKSGTLTDENKVFVKEVAGIMKKAAISNYDREALRRAKQYSKTNPKYDTEELYYMFNPDGEYQGVSNDATPTPKPDGTQPTVTPKGKRTIKLKSGKTIEVED